MAEATSPHPDVERAIAAGRLHPLRGEPRVEYGGLSPVARASGRRFNPTPRLLVLLLDFPDRPAQPGFEPAHFEDLYFSRGTRETVSLRDYYLEASYGQMDVTGEVHGWIRMPQSYAFYAHEASGVCGNCFPNNARGLAAHAVDAALARGIDPARFDHDDDGIIDGFILVFPGQGSERTFSNRDFHSHYWNMTANTAVGDIGIPDYALVAADENVGVVVHEYGHVLGGDDLYDTRNLGNGLGDFSVMAKGNWFDGGRRPGGPDPFTRAQWGFVTPENVGADEPRIEIRRVNENPHVLRLWREGVRGREYFLIENRAAVGIDGFLPGEGILVYHVNESIQRQDDASRYRVSVVQADGLDQLGLGLPRSQGDAGDFLPGSAEVYHLDDDTQPSLRDQAGEPTGVSIDVLDPPGPVMRIGATVGISLGGAPRPRVELVLDDGGFAEGIEAGRPATLRVFLHNEGTRLEEGTLTLISRDPAVTLITPYEVPMPGLGALASRDFPVPLRVETRSTGTPRAVALEARLDLPDARYTLNAVLPLAANLIRRESFELEVADVNAVAVDPASTVTWVRSDRRVSHGTRAWWSGAYPERSNQALVLGPFVVNETAEVRFDQFMHAQSLGEWALDGGFLEISDDGGATWALLEPEGGYPHRFTLTDGNPYTDKPAWSGRAETWESVRVPVVGYTGPIFLRFVFASDFSGAGVLYDGWTVDALEVRSWDGAHAVSLDPAPPDAHGQVRVGVRFTPMLPTPVPAWVRLVRSRGAEEVVLGSWSAVERLTTSVRVPPITPGDAVWLEWESARRYRSQPVFLSAPADSRSLLAGTPAVMTAAGGWVTYRVVGDGGAVCLELLDVRGARVRTLVQDTLPSGTHRVRFPDHDDTGRSLASGVYFLRFVTDASQATQKIIRIP